jgi:hypothetical protein
LTAKPAVEKDRQPLKPGDTSKKRIGTGLFRARCVCVFCVEKGLLPDLELISALRFIRP